MCLSPRVLLKRSLCSFAGADGMSPCRFRVPKRNEGMNGIGRPRCPQERGLVDRFKDLLRRPMPPLCGVGDAGLVVMINALAVNRYVTCV